MFWATVRIHYLHYSVITQKTTTRMLFKYYFQQPSVLGMLAGTDWLSYR